MIRYLVIDGMLNGTGIRDYYDGGYVDPASLGLPPELNKRISDWLGKYETEHYNGYGNLEQILQLDNEGIEIAKSIERELPESKIAYYSSANLRQMNF